VSDRVFIKGLTVETVIGVYDWERNITQPLVIDLDMTCDTTKAAATDSIDDALDYAAISSRIIEVSQASAHQLIETLAEQLAALVLAEFQVTHVRLTVTKPGAVAQAAGVGVVIERGSL